MARVMVMAFVLAAAPLFAQGLDSGVSTGDALDVQRIVLASGKEYTREEVEAKVKKFRKFKAFGLTGVAVGIPLAITGMVLLANYDSDQTSNSPGHVIVNAGDVGALFRFTALSGGLVLFGGGIALSSIGHRKVTEYQGAANRVSLRWNVSAQKVAMHIACEF